MDKQAVTLGTLTVETDSVAIAELEPGTVIDLFTGNDNPTYKVVVTSPEDGEVVVEGKVGLRNERPWCATLATFPNLKPLPGRIVTGSGLKFYLHAGGTVQVLEVTDFTVRDKKEDLEEVNRLIKAAAH